MAAKNYNNTPECFPNNKCGESDDIQLKQKETGGIDPLGGVGHVSHETEYYRLNETVFADTLKLHINKQPLKANKQEEMTFVGNVTVHKGTGKNLKYHFHVDSTKLVCPQSNCKKLFATATLLKAHVRKIHCSDRARFQCEVCSNAFPARYLLRRHMAVHDGTKVECPVCRKMLSARTKLAQHMRTRSHLNRRRSTQTQPAHKE